MVPKRAAVDEPTCEEILAAARACGYDGSIDASSTFPGEARKARGRVQVERQGSKSDLLKNVSEQMRRSRQQ
jgi:signal recognition particle subunit SEC65